VRVLIGDGYPVARLGLSQIVASIQDETEILEAASFSECLDAVKQNGGVDLAVVDTCMTDIPWEQGLRRLREECGATPIIAMAHHENRADVFRMIELGASGFVPCSAGPDQLTKAINLVMSGAVYLPRSVITPSERPSGQQKTADSPAPEMLSEAALPMLTRRQREVLKWLAEGKRNSEIAEILGTSEFTIRVHVSAILKGLGVANRTQAALKAKDILRDNS